MGLVVRAVDALAMSKERGARVKKRARWGEARDGQLKLVGRQVGQDNKAL